MPDRIHGYCIDDNARALILVSAVPSTAGDDLDRLSTTYAGFIQHAWNPNLGRFRNFMRFDRSWCEEAGSEDSNGRALWSLGYAATEGQTPATRDWAVHLFDRTAPLAAELGSPRARAFAALGAAKLLSGIPSHELARAILGSTGNLLGQLLDASRRPEWTWFEEVLGYDNARLPEALIRAGCAIGRPDWINQGIETLDWLITVQTSNNGYFQPVGTDSLGRRHEKPCLSISSRSRRRRRSMLARPLTKRPKMFGGSMWRTGHMIGSPGVIYLDCRSPAL